MLEALQGKNPTALQTLATLVAGIGAAAVILLNTEASWQNFILAFIAADWVGGIIANAAESTRDWWRKRPKLRLYFYIVHLMEIPVLWWLSGGGLLFQVLALTLVAKLSVFALGGKAS